MTSRHDRGEMVMAAHGHHDREGRQQALLAAAMAVFAARGYDAATTREVAEQAGCAEGLIHRYFGGKRGLLLAILDRKAVEMVAEYRGAVPDRETVAGEVEQLLLWPLDAMWEHRDFMRVAVSRAIIDHEVGRRIVAMNEWRIRMIADKLRRNQEAGRIPTDADVEGAAETIFALGFQFGFINQVVMHMDRDRVHDLALRAACLLARGLAAP